MKENTPTIDWLMALRGFAAIMIVLGHMQYGGIWPEPKLLGRSIQWLTFAPTQIYVWIFFILSGYLIGKGFFTGRYTLNLKGLGMYFLKRFKRIAPPYYIVLAANVILFGLWKWYYFEHNLFFASFFLGSHLITNLGFDYLWAISVEMQWYVLAPFFFFLITILSGKIRIHKLFLLILVIVFGLCLRYYGFETYTIKNWGIYIENIISPIYFNLEFFLAGMTFNLFLLKNMNASPILYFPRILGLRKHPMVFAISIFAVFHLFSSYINHQLMMGQFDTFIRIYGMVFPTLTIVTCLLFIYLAEHDGYHRSYVYAHQKLKSVSLFFKPSSFLFFIGTLSLELYLVHIPLMKLFHLHCIFESFGCTSTQFFQRFFFLLTLSIFCAWILHNVSMGITALVKTGFEKIRPFR